jgi:hypothetical protein
MKVIILVFAALTSFSALGKSIEVNCTTKAFVCSGMNCGWISTSQPNPTVVQMVRDPNFPKEEAPYEVFYADYRRHYDNHALTLRMTYKTLPDAPVTVRAILDGGNVFAEATGIGSLEIGLRNHSYGRGFNCTSIRAID